MVDYLETGRLLSFALGNDSPSLLPCRVYCRRSAGQLPVKHSARIHIVGLRVMSAPVTSGYWQDRTLFINSSSALFILSVYTLGRSINPVEGQRYGTSMYAQTAAVNATKPHSFCRTIRFLCSLSFLRNFVRIGLESRSFHASC